MRNDQPNKGNRMTKERLNALHEMRAMANDLWVKLLTDTDESDHSLNFIEWGVRRDYRSTMRQLAEDITNLIHDELGASR